MSRPRPKPLPLVAQLRQLLAQHPGSTGSVHRSELRWEGTLQPAPLSDVYLVSITHKIRSRPKVCVLDPPLERRPGKRIPHTFPDESLCLHLRDEWDDHHAIARTIVPWASEWLLHYEIWLATGAWHGGGHEPTPKRGPDNRRADPPSDTAPPASSDRTPRNAPCPCGSGTKFKRCHGSLPTELDPRFETPRTDLDQAVTTRNVNGPAPGARFGG